MPITFSNHNTGTEAAANERARNSVLVQQSGGYRIFQRSDGRYEYAANYTQHVPASYTLVSSWEWNSLAQRWERIL